MKLAGPKTPHWLNIIQYISNPLGFLEKTASRYGDTFTLSGSLSTTDSRTVVVVSHPKALKQVFTRPQDITSPGELHQAMAPFIGENSLLLIDGSRHRHRRKLLRPSFHGKCLYDYGRSICEITEKIVNSYSPNQIFLAYDALQEISLQIILETVLGLRQEGLRRQLRQRYVFYKKCVNSPLIPLVITVPILRQDFGKWTPWGRFLYAKQQINELIYVEINKCRHQNDPSRTDILNTLISARDESGETMTDDELCEDLRLMFFAGQEPPATAVAWAIYWLHNHPEILEKLRKELDDLGTDADPVNIAQLPYLTAVCNETMRISPVIPFTSPRLAEVPIELMGYKLEANTILECCTYLTHQREDLYPEPKKFRPERFLEREFTPYEFLPFGGGMRGCIAQPFAEYEIKLILATLISRYEWQLLGQRPERYWVEGTILRPAKGVQIKRLKQRSRKSKNAAIYS